MKKIRQMKLRDLLRGGDYGNQEELLAALAANGIATTQASVSRDLNELGIIKVNGAYRLPRLEIGQSQYVEQLTVEPIGDHLIVVFVGRGHAPSAATHIDAARIPGVAGTVAGDDTVMIAVRDAEHQKLAV
jgi:transcriptional regulator of arginine metabolism